MSSLYKNMKILKNKVDLINSKSNTYVMKVINSTKNELINILKYLFIEKGIITVAVSFIIATQTNSLATMLIDNILAPIIIRVIEIFEKRPISELQNYEFKYLGVKIKIGVIIINLLKFVFIIIIIYYISLLSKPENLEKLLKFINNIIPN